MRKRTLTAYGEVLDQEKLAVLAQEAGCTVSTWIVQHIRNEYQRLYGDTDPQLLRKNA